MLKDPKFRSATRGVDAIWIWGTALVWLATFIFGLIDDWGMAISFLLALAAIPLAIVSIAAYRNRRQLMRALTRFFGGESELTQAASAHPHDPNLFEYDAALEAKDSTAYYDLMNFALTHVLPACESQIELQKAVIKRLSATDEVAGLAVGGLHTLDHPGSQRFWMHFDNIVYGIDSSEPTIKFDALIDSIKGLETNAYREFCQKGNERATSGKVDKENDKELRELLEKWVADHNKLVRDYDAIKSDVRFGDKLFRPRKSSRWGNIIELPNGEG